MKALAAGFAALCAFAVSASLLAADAGTTGWRGNGTGVFPNADPPTKWERRCKSVAGEIRTSARKPAGAAAGTPIEDAYIGEWLLLGPVAGDASVDAALSPEEGDKAGGAAWSRKTFPSAISQARKDAAAPWNVAIDGDFVDLNRLGKGTRQAAWAHVYLNSPRAGKVALALAYSDSIKVWVNGNEVYAGDKPAHSPLNSSSHYTVNAFGTFPDAPRANVELKQGWNHLLMKVAQSQNPENKAWYFNVRVVPTTDADYESKGIVWETKMPSWGRANPIIVGDKVFAVSEPDELVCLNKKDGKILWVRSTTWLDAVSEKERAENPAFKPAVELAEKLRQAATWKERQAIRAQLYPAMVKVDATRFKMPTSYHAPAYGFTTAAPVSDGSRVYVYFGHGIVAAYDLAGKLLWCRTVLDMGNVADYNNSSPLLVGDKLILLRYQTRAFNKLAGEVVWTSVYEKPAIDQWHNVEATVTAHSPSAARVGGVDVVLSWGRRPLRVSDGKMLSEKVLPTHWPTAVVAGEFVYDFNDMNVTRWRLKSESADRMELTDETKVYTGSDLNNYASVLLHEGLLYGWEFMGMLRVFDAQTLQPVWKQQFPAKLWFHYNACGCAASPAAAGKYVYLRDNQGDTFVIEAGRAYKPVSVNRIEDWVAGREFWNVQEETYSSPIFEGARMYVRDQESLYCVGK